MYANEPSLKTAEFNVAKKLSVYGTTDPSHFLTRSVQAELSELQMNLEFLSPMRDMRNQYPFRGDEEIDLNEAMGLMDRMQSMDDLERQIERYRDKRVLEPRRVARKSKPESPDEEAAA